jgi:hypothetical protein
MATTSAATSASPSDTITVTGSGQLIDPGASNKSIAFIAGASNDTLVLYAGGVDQISGFGNGGPGRFFAEFSARPVMVTSAVWTIPAPPAHRDRRIAI